MSEQIDILLDQIKGEIASDAFDETSPVEEYSLSTSIKLFHEHVLAFINKFDPLLLDNSGRFQVNKIGVLFESAGGCLMEIFSDEKEKTESQSLNIIGAFEFLANPFLSSISHQLSVRLTGSDPI